MSSELRDTTLQAVFLSALTNVLAQAITAYKRQDIHLFDVQEVLRFAVFGLLITPLNFYWQGWLEDCFPTRVPKRANSLGSAVKRGDEQKSVSKENSGRDTEFSSKNAAAKFFLDQTVGCWANTAAFVLLVGVLRGKHPASLIENELKRNFWTMVLSSYGFWPLITLLNLVVVPVQHRILVGNVSALIWGVYVRLVLKP